MPKITINPEGQGIRQARGKGLQHLSASNKGIAYHVQSGTFSAAMAAGDTEVTDIFVPAGAVVTKLCLKVETPSVDGGTGSALANTITHINVGTTAFTLAAPVNLVGVSADDILIYDLNHGATGISKVGALDVSTQVAGGRISLKETASNKESEDTGASITVVVEFYQPMF